MENTKEDEKTSKKVLWEKTLTESREIKLSNSRSLMLHVGINKLNSGSQEPIIDIWIDGDYEVTMHINAKSYNVYRRIIKDFVNAFDYFNREEIFNGVIEARVKELESTSLEHGL